MTAIGLISPMLCKSIESDALDKLARGYIPELKLDGMRALVYKLDGELRVFGRSGIEYTDHLHPLTYAGLSQSIPDNTILDGELAHVTEWKFIHGVDVPVVDFNKTMRVMGSGSSVARKKQEDTTISFLAFDLLKIDNQDLMLDSFISRSSILREAFHGGAVTPAPQFTYTGRAHFKELFNTLSEHGFEGLVLKREDGIYLPSKRGVQQLKVKAVKFFDVIVTGATAGQGKYAGLIGALKFSVYDPKTQLFTEIGQCSGMTDYSRITWSKFIRSEAWVNGAKPVIEIKCNDLLSTGTPRHPQYVRERTDKPWTECTMEQFNVN